PRGVRSSRACWLPFAHSARSRVTSWVADMVCALKTLNFGRGDCTPMCSRLVRQHISPQNEDSSCMIDFRSGFRMCKWKDGGDKLELPRRLGPSAIDYPSSPTQTASAANQGGSREKESIRVHHSDNSNLVAGGFHPTGCPGTTTTEERTASLHHHRPRPGGRLGRRR